jgi:guanosine-3',5'-bis(diphosphate) 3'-pyrophosphohydrolase
MNDFLNLKKQEKRLKRLIENFSEEERNLIDQALKLVKKQHSGQKRDEGTSLVIHPIRVACSLIEEAGIKDAQTICGALLHDIYEYTDISLETIKKKFGQRLFEIVDISTRNQKGDTEENKYERKQEHILNIMKKDKHIRAIKACDYLDNVRCWPYIHKNHSSVKKLPRWFKEAENLYLPLAESVSSELAELMKQALAEAHFKWDNYI